MVRLRNLNCLNIVWVLGPPLNDHVGVSLNLLNIFLVSFQHVLLRVILDIISLLYPTSCLYVALRLFLIVLIVGETAPIILNLGPLCPIHNVVVFVRDYLIVSGVDVLIQML